MSSGATNLVELGQWASTFQTENLYSGNFYKLVENFNRIEKYDEYCNTDSIPEDNKIHMRNICAKILNYLETIYSTLGSTQHEYDVCKLLNYWVFSRLSIIYNSSDTAIIKSAFNILENIWNKFIRANQHVLNIKECKPDIVLLDHKDWKLSKDLFDYYVDIRGFILTAKLYKEGCENYYKYVKYKNGLFDYFDKPCSISYNLDCPSFFEKCKEYHPKKVLPEFKCYHDMKKMEEAQAEVQEEAEDEAHPFTPLSSQENTDSSVPIAKTASNALLGVVVTSMTSGALYKFTPLGTILRNKFGWNNSNMSNINGGNNGIYNYASESFNPYTGGEEHYIGYHPA